MSILKAFTTHFKEFMNDIQVVFPKDPEIRTTKFFFTSLIAVNPKSILVGWKACVNDVYEKEIIEGDFDFFLNKDYRKDLEGAEGESNILQSIEIFRHKIKNMGDENKNKSIKYMQNLTKLCKLYYSKR
jgi:hypothetical protein|tara:strand:+ start:13819 stop:14205 length:387 start_codon:yes stop_codon:yes gene_type:complete